MRKYKFRAWFYGKNRMVYNLGFDDRSFMEIDDKELSEDEMPAVWDKDTIVDDSYYDGAFSYEIMEWIGLTNKEGKDIYRGDILMRPYDYESICTVEWDKERCGYMLCYLFYDESYDMSEFWDDFEVIGNIYENPELLEV
jgi:uncharacterized phage protein (TIGR01671 family)